MVLASAGAAPRKELPLPEFDIRLVDLTFLRGPNRWSYRPAMEALVDIGELEAWPSNRCPHLIQSLDELLPGLRTHGCSYEEPGGFLRRLAEGTWPAHILEHVTLELLDLLGHRVGFGRARSAGATGHYYVIVRSPVDQLTEACFDVARRLLVQLYRGERPSTIPDMEALRRLSQTVSAPAAMARVRASAERARTPMQRFDHSDLLVLGQGSRQRRLFRGTTDGTSAIADGIARDKELLLLLLREAGAPTAQPLAFSSAAELIREAEDEPSNFVVKAARSTSGKAVTVGISSREELQKASELALEYDSTILLERWVPGQEFELLVIGGRVVSAVTQTPAELEGDGHHTLAELLSLFLETKLRGPWSLPKDSLVKRVLDAPNARKSLESLGLMADSVLLHQQTASLLLPASIAGKDVGPIHEQVARAAVTAVRVVGLDMAAVTVIATSLAHPLEESGGAIIGVQASPSWLSHLPPEGATNDPAADALLQHLVPINEGARVPVVLVSGLRDCDEVVELLSYFLRIAGRRVGAARSGALWLGSRLTHSGPIGFDEVENLVFGRSVDAVVVHSSVDDVLRKGLPSDRSLLSIVTSFDGAAPTAHLPNQDAYSHLMRTLVDVVLPSGAAILNADDEGARSLAEYCDGEVIFYGTHKSDPFLERHAVGGGRSIGFRGGRMVLRSGNFILERPIGNQVAASVWLPAFAAAIKLDLSPELLIGALHSKTWNEEPSLRKHDRKERASRPDL